MSKFAPIHIISGYSLLRSGLTMKRIETALKKEDYFGMGLTDEGILSGFPPFAHLMKDNNKPYVLGLSLQVEENDIVVYAINEDGYHHLIKLSSENQKEPITLSFLKENAFLTIYYF